MEAVAVHVPGERWPQIEVALAQEAALLGVDPRGVLVRGLGPQYTLSTFNGRILATDGAGRDFAYDVLPSDVISGADVIKGADEINKLWKMVTLSHPSWTIGDIVGGLYLASFGGLNVPNMVKRAKDAMSFLVPANASRRQDFCCGSSPLVVTGRGRDFRTPKNLGV